MLHLQVDFKSTSISVFIPWEGESIILPSLYSALANITDLFDGK